MTPTVVDDAEDLYRAVRSNSTEYKVEGTLLRFSASAFNDAEQKPSVDRSSIRLDPKDARKSATDGVTKLVARDVRSIHHIVVNPDKKGIGDKQYGVDVHHRPIAATDDEPSNPAHCQIECAHIAKTHFKKLKEALARQAEKYGFVVQPT